MKNPASIACIVALLIPYSIAFANQPTRLNSSQQAYMQEAYDIQEIKKEYYKNKVSNVIELSTAFLIKDSTNIDVLTMRARSQFIVGKYSESLDDIETIYKIQGTSVDCGIVKDGARAEKFFDGARGNVFTLGKICKNSETQINTISFPSKIRIDRAVQVIAKNVKDRTILNSTFQDKGQPIASKDSGLARVRKDRNGFYFINIYDQGKRRSVPMIDLNINIKEDQDFRKIHPDIDNINLATFIGLGGLYKNNTLISVRVAGYEQEFVNILDAQTGETILHGYPANECEWRNQKNIGDIFICSNNGVTDPYTISVYYGIPKTPLSQENYKEILYSAGLIQGWYVDSRYLYVLLKDGSIRIYSISSKLEMLPIQDIRNPYSSNNPY